MYNFTREDVDLEAIRMHALENLNAYLTGPGARFPILRTRVKVTRIGHRCEDRPVVTSGRFGVWKPSRPDERPGE
jgi:hypothetical protein